VDLVYESVGGDMFDLAVNALAAKGRVGLQQRASPLLPQTS
jgi:NADPH-dependent curcumin reductase CurA